jgi:hypothetical protein
MASKFRGHLRIFDEFKKLVEGKNLSSKILGIFSKSYISNSYQLFLETLDGLLVYLLIKH